MNKSFEAYYSPQWAWLWLVLAILFAICIALFAFLLPYPLSLILTLSFSVCLFLWMYRRTKQQTGIVAEIVEDVLILYKKETMSIPLQEIQRIDMNDDYGSFDLIVKTAGKRIHFHCSIKDQIKKKQQLIRYLKSKNVNVQTFDML